MTVDCGKASMILAERILLKHALLDSFNERFLFLSDSFADTKEGRYNPKMHHVIPVHNWRKGSQWVEGLEEEITRKTLTHTSWVLSSFKDRERRGWHPMTYKLVDATTTLIQSIKDIDNIYYETEYRREWCTSKGKPSLCFLFARKFTRLAVLRLLNMLGKDEQDDVISYLLQRVNDKRILVLQYRTLVKNGTYVF
ncbi:unnamed protein product [Camellia sinensis]